MRRLITEADSCSPENKLPSRAFGIRVLVPAFMIFFTASCAGSRELTRERAAEMIANSGDFRAHVALPLKKEVDLIMRAEAEESESEARARAVETYYQANPQMDVLRQLGLTNVRAVLRKRPEENYGTWPFDIEPFLTEKGEKTTAGEQDDRSAPSVPLARREFVKVTGITKAGDVLARVQYAWRESPTEAGRAFVPGNPEYERLPASLRQALEQRNQTKDYGKTKRGTAVFQLFDDGWRLLAIR